MASKNGGSFSQLHCREYQKRVMLIEFIKPLIETNKMYYFHKKGILDSRAIYESLKNHIHNNVSIMKNVDCFVHCTHAHTHKNAIQNIENKVLS